jgi:Uma2 family endonuclease
MATVPEKLKKPATDDELDYPTSDGRPMAETDLHRDDMVDSIESLKMFYAGRKVYVSSNILLYYEKGNKRRHVSPDVLVAKELNPGRRKYYLLWQEGKPPDLVIEFTSHSTKDEDIEDKYELYRDTIKVREYFLFDPQVDYLHPPLQGYRLVRGNYVRIEPVNGRLPSRELGLHLEADGNELRFWNPKTELWLPTPREAREQAEAARQQAELARERADLARQQSEVARQRAELNLLLERAAREKAEAEAIRAKAELDALRQHLKSK